MKRLIVCSDGTWNQPGKGYPTNVQKLAEVVRPQASDGLQQQVFYDRGLGTNPGLDQWLGGAFGWGIDRNIQDGYQFLMQHYEPGDEVYLFGFSRGAYTVRSLAGFLYCSGLLPRDREADLKAAYALYRDEKVTPSHPKAQEFRARHNSLQIEITLVGCWDTVGALGVPQIVPWLPLDNAINRKYRFHDTFLNRKIRYALHSLSIDERRRAFQATLMQPSQGASTQIEEVWFPGDHGCTGGGQPQVKGLSDAALEWMVSSLANWGLGLEIDLDRVDGGLHPDPLTPFDNEISGVYRFVGAIDREIDGRLDCLHLSVKRRWRDEPNYRPVNLVGPFQQELEAWAIAHPA